MIISSSHFLELIKGNKKLSEVLVPKLLHRLIRESVNNNSYTHFPSGDDIFTPGWDGIVDNNQIDHRFLPIGNSYFEIGAKTNCYKGFSKIGIDYENRKTDPTITNKSEYSYIAVTTAILDSKKKQDYTARYNKDNIFKKVIILDAIDITNWIEDHINICIWFLQSYNEKIDDYDINLLSEEWNRIALCTIPNLTFNLFKVGNERNSTKLINDFLEIKSNRIVSISSQFYGRDFAYIFCIASLMDSSNTDLIERTIIVNSQSAMNYVNAFCSGKIVLVNFNCFDDRFAVNLNNTYVFFDYLFGDDIRLDIIQQKDFEKEVEKLGFLNSEAHKISHTIDYHPLALRRILSKIPSVKIPFWSKSSDKNDLIPLLLLGEINMDDQGSVDFLKAIIGDNLDIYIEKLNLWSEVRQSPILKYDNIFRICSRIECFDFLQIDLFSSKLRKTEDYLVSALTEVNEKYRKENDMWLLNDGSYKWNYRLIENIINGFIILSEKNKKSQLHFDLFVGKIFTNLYGNYELTLTVAQFFKLLSELSPRSFLAYIRKSINEDKDTFLKFINTTYSSIIMNNIFIHDVLYSIETVLKVESTALNGLELLLDIYYLVNNNDEIIFNEVIKCLSPIATMTGLIAIPLSRKIDFFYKYSEGKSVEKTSRIVKKLYGDNLDNIMIGISNTYRSCITKEITVTYSEIFEMKTKAFSWLIEHNKDTNELIVTIKQVLHNIHTLPLNDIKKQLDIIKTKAILEEDEVKSKISREILRTRENILKFPNWDGLSIYISIFDDILREIKPLDDYIAVKYLLLDDNYPLMNPPSIDDVDWYVKANDQRLQEKAIELHELIGKYGQDILSKLVDDSDDTQGYIWKLLYNFSDNHRRDLEKLIERRLTNGLRVFLRCFTDEELDIVLKQYSNEILIIQNLPYTEKTYKWIDGNTNEKEYWKNQFFDNLNKNDFDYLFNKFLNFAPEKLINFYAYFDDMDYEHNIKLLKTILELFENKSNQNIIVNDIYSIQEYVRRLDNKYYTDELSLLEFKLLPILKSGIEDYPMGIKKYFWNHPEELGNLLVQLFETREALASGSMGKKILFEAIYSFGNSCYIPQDYLTQKRSEIKKWVDTIIKCGESKDTQIKKLLKSAIINTLVCYPKNITDKIWPIKEVADIIEYIASSDYDDKYSVSRKFSSSYTNRRGVRTVSDGSIEYSLYEEYKKNQEFYQFTHPVTSRALEYIANGYIFDAENDKKRSILGND